LRMSDCAGLIIPEQSGICQRDELRKEIEFLRQSIKGVPELKALLARKDEALRWVDDILVNVLDQACGSDEGKVDSRALSFYADALRYLAKRGRFKIQHEAHRRIIGRFIPDPGLASHSQSSAGTGAP
jgi:hypothetical protein